MKKRFSLFLLMIFLSAFLMTARIIEAAPVVTVTSPNGGEVWSGSNTITWTTSDASNSQTILADLYYGNPANTVSHHSIVSDLNLLNPTICNFNIASQWQQETSFENGLAGYALGALTQPLFYSFNNSNTYALFVGSRNNTKINSFKWNGTTWLPDYDFNVGLKLSDAISTTGAIFSISSDVYLLYDDNSSVFGARGGKTLLGYKWDGSHWQPNNDINRFSNATPAQYLPSEEEIVSMASFDYLGTQRLLLYFSVGTSTYVSAMAYDWNGAGWIRNASLEYSAFPDQINTTANQLFGLTAWNDSGTLKLIATSNGGLQVAKVFIDGNWQLSGDVNKGIATPAAKINLSNHFTYNGKNYIFRTFSDGAKQGDWNAYVNGGNLYDTTTTANCSYEWDTTTAENNFWFLDINVDNGTSTTVDSSNAIFKISNLSEGDLNVFCVENCTVEGFDGNAVVLLPVDELKQLKFYAQNNSVGKAFKIKIKNSLVDGRRYFAYDTTPRPNNDANYYLSYSYTFGDNGAANHTDGIQKIWNPSTKKFEHTMIEPNIGGGQKYYYLLKYQMPAKQWNTLLNSIDWDNQLTPQSSPDLNGLTADIFSTGSNAQITSELRNKIMDTTTFHVGTNNVFVFTAKATTGSNTLAVGVTATKGAMPSTTATINSIERTYDFDNIENGYLGFKTSGNAVSTIQVYDYALITRNYFLKEVEIKDEFNNELPTIIDNNVSWQYVREGEKYRVQTTIYDRNGDIDKVEVFTYLETINDANLVNYSVYDYSDKRVPESTYVLDLPQPPIIDFTSGNKKMQVKVKVTGRTEKLFYYSEVSSRWLELVQFPYYPSDFSIKANVLNKIVAQNPKITINIRDIRPDTLRGVNIAFYYAEKQSNQSDYNKTYYKDIDFTCLGFNCTIEKDISDWIFPHSGVWHFTASALLTTENEDVNNKITSHTLTFNVSTREYQTFRLFEAIERNSVTAPGKQHTYKNTEEIGFVLQIRDANPQVNLKNILDVNFNIFPCDANFSDGACGGSLATINQSAYTPDSFLYDEKTGYNYYFIKRVWTKPSGELLDENYYRVTATIKDKSLSHGEDSLTTILTSKCIAYNVFFLGNSLNMNDIPGHCTTVQDAVITDANIVRETRITIDNDISLTAPKIEAVYCLNYDNVGNFVDPINQEKICAILYSFKQGLIDKFDITLSNPNTDYSKTGKDVQYLRVTIPYSQILFNDLELTKQLLSKDGTQMALTVGDLMFQGLSNIGESTTNMNIKEINDYLVCCVSNHPPMINCPAVFARGWPGSKCRDMNVVVPPILTKNFGTIDYNLDYWLTDNSVDGILFTKIKGIKTINVQDYLKSYPDLNIIDSKDVLEYANYKGYKIPIKTTRVEVYGNGVEKFYAADVPSPLIIDEIAGEVLKRKQIDENTYTNYDTIPVALKMNFVTDMIYDMELRGQRVVVPFVANIEISNERDWGGTVGKILIKNWFIILLLVVGLLYISTVYRNFKQGG